MKAHASRSNQSGDQGRAQASSEYGTRQSLSDIGDTAPFLDILPQAELTPKVSQALSILILII